ncbi:MAG: FAD-dependent oxidoreductase [Steroidobacteraceae bacterium]
MPDSDDSVLEVDLLVLGAGMAGMSAAAYAAHHGASVLVMEKGRQIGGSAVLSGGGFWTATSYEVLREVNPQGEARQAHVLIDGYEEAAAWIRSLDVMMTARMSTNYVQSFDSVGYSFDVAGYINACKAYVTSGGGWVVTSTQVSELVLENGAVIGAIALDESGAMTRVRSRWTLLATGGFQNSPGLRARYIGPHAAHFIVRSNPNSAGDGLSLGLAAGAALSPHMDGWYGHTIPTPLNRPFEERDYLPLAQFFLSPRSVLLNRRGERFMDESRGYYLNAQAVAQLPEQRALLVYDERTHQEDTQMFGVDRSAVATAAGAHTARASTLAELQEQVAAWRYDNVEATLAEYNAQVSTASHALTPPRSKHARPLIAPLYAIEVQPAITFTHGGLRIDPQSRVLNARNEPIAGLLAAGADAGGTYHQAYAGGLAMACVFGLQAARTVLHSIHGTNNQPGG